MRSRALGHTRSARRRTTAAAAVLVLAGLAGCTSTTGGPAAGGSDGPGSSGASESATPKPDPVRLTTSFTDSTAVPIDGPVTVSASGGDLDEVTMSSAAGTVAGRVNGSTWTAQDRLEPGTDYTIDAKAVRSDGSTVERTRSKASSGTPHRRPHPRPADVRRDRAPRRGDRRCRHAGDRDL